MTHRRVHRAAAIVVVAPGERTRLAQGRQHMHAAAWVRAELVPLVAARPLRRQPPGGGPRAVLDGHRPARDPAVMALEARADQSLVPGPAAPRVRGGVHADKTAAAPDIAFERALLIGARDGRP